MSRSARDLSRVACLGYIGLGVRDLDAWQSFVTDVLGLQWAGRLPDASQLVRMDAQRHRLILTPTGEDDISFAGWEVPSSAALIDLEQHLLREGTDVRRGSADLAAARGVEDLLCLQDCDGLPLEIYYGPQIETRKPFVSTQALSGFKAGALGFGHIVLTVGDTVRTERFYRQSLGLRTTDYIHLDLAPGVHTKAVFMRCNPRHHSLALVAAPLPKRLLHFMVEVESIDEVGQTLERASAAQVPISAQLGRHTNDRMLSFYMQSPSGFEVEFGCGGRLIDETEWRLEVFDKAEIWGHQRG